MDLQQKLNQIKRDMKESLQNEVTKYIKDKMQEHIRSDVYGQYHRLEALGFIDEPFVYERRYENGGLISRENIKMTPTENGIMIENITKGSNQSIPLAELVEHGDGYNGCEYDNKENRDNTSYQYLQPRPFLKNTKEEIENSKECIEIIKNSMKNKGYIIK